MRRLRRPLWTYRQPLCMVGWHAYSVLRQAKLEPEILPDGSTLHHTVYRLVKWCDRPGCAKSKEVS